MSRDDMFVVMYRILKYLYSCMKKGIPADADLVELSGVNEPYYYSIMNEMIDHRLVKGFRRLNTKDMKVIVADEPSITMEGVEFLQENSMMKKAERYLADIKSAIPGA